MDKIAGPRRWYRIHWLTGLVAAGLSAFSLYMLCSATIQAFYYGNLQNAFEYSYGWPRVLLVLSVDSKDGHAIFPAKFTASALLFDLSIMLGMILGVAANFEYWLRRRASRRAWLRIHLSTAVVLTIIAGAVLSLQFAEPVSESYEEFISTYGWPFPAHFVTRHNLGETTAYTSTAWNEQAVLVDLMIALAILASVTTVCEWIIARRKNKELPTP